MRLVVRTDGGLSEARIAGAAGIETGMDLMQIDLDAVRERLEDLPNVRRAIVTRTLPDQLLVAVEEHIPVAWLSCPPQGIRARSRDRGLLIDELGTVFRCLGGTSEADALPVIDAYRIARPVEGGIVESREVHAALALIDRSDRLFDGRGLDIEEVRVKNEWSLECLYRDGMTVTFDRHQVERGLDDLSLIVDKIRTTPLQIATVNVAVRKNIPVTFQGEVDWERLSEAEAALPGADPGEETGEAILDRREKHLRSILSGG